jgi:ribonuclease E
VDILRKKGQKVSASRADRETKEGLVVTRLTNGNAKGILLSLTCETDFVAKNEGFGAFANSLIDAAVSNGSTTTAEVLALPMEGSTIAEKIIEMTGKIGEKIEISHFEVINADQVVTYVHSNGKLGVLVGLVNTSGNNVEEAGKDVAMQIAAMNPVAVDKDGVDATTIEREIEIGKEQARAEGKPEEAIIEDLEVLQKQWELVQQEAVTSRAPALLNRDDDFIQRVLRDMYGGDVNRIVVDSSTGLKRVKQYLQNWSGGQTPQGLLIDHHRDRSPILEYFRINAAVREALRPRVDLPSGGYVIIQPTEALTVIDVNSGSFTRSATARETVLWTNCEAAAEIARQLRLRNIAGVIVVDFIDMESRRDQMQVLEHFNKALKADKARPQIAQLTELGLVELTRKRQGQNIYELFGETCPTCGGLGHTVRLPGETENRLPIPAADIPERFVPMPQRESRTPAPTRIPDIGSVAQATSRDTYDGFGDGFETEPEFSSLHLINHPSYQELNDKRRTRTRRSRIGVNGANDKDESRLPTNPLAFVNHADLDLEEPELPIPEIAPPTINKSGWTERPERAKVKLEPIKVEPPEIINVEMSAKEQDTFAEMGISPLLKLDREGKNPRSVIINVVQPGQSPIEETEFIPEPIVMEKTIPEVVTIKIPKPTFELQEESSFPPLAIFPELTIVPQVKATETEGKTEIEAEIEAETNNGSTPNRRRRRRSSALDPDVFGL